MPKVLVPLAPGCEDIETVTIIDVLRRAQINVIVASLDGQSVTAARGCRLLPDMSLDQALAQGIDSFDAIALPGGQPGTQNLMADPRIIQACQNLAQAGKVTAAICAAPGILAKAGLLNGKMATSYPGALESFSDQNIQITGSAWTQDGTILTGKSAGTAMDFSLALVEKLLGKNKRQEVESKLERQ